jgi:hypothetical protein
MADLVVIVGVAAFFAIAAWYVAGCDRIIGRDDDVSAPATDGGARGEVAAMTEATR